MKFKAEDYAYLYTRILALPCASALYQGTKLTLSHKTGLKIKIKSLLRKDG